MSTVGRPTRTRSIRNLASRETESAQDKPRNEPRSGSPSRLPMRPPTRPTRSSTIASSSTTTSRTKAAGTVPARQTSVSFAKPSPRLAENSAPAPTKPLTRASSIRQTPSTTTASSTTATRSVSISRPKSSGGSHPTTTPKERQPGHSRAKSTITSLSTATTLRPPSQPTAPSRSNPSPASSTTSTASTSAQTKRTRTNSQSQSSTTTTAPLAPRRPAFSTNQQHYSPAKSTAPKPLTSTFLAPPSPSKQPVNIALTAETSRLQTELLQLSLLHRDAHATTAKWHDSARAKLKARFEEAAGADKALRAAEQDAAEARGMQDLLRWGEATIPAGKGTAGTDAQKTGVLPLDERVRLLDQVLNGVWALGEPGSRYQRAVRAFEDWARQVAEIRAAQRGGDVDALLSRSRGAGEERGFGIFVGDLDTSAWKRDRAGLARVLEGWRSTLVLLGDAGGCEDGDNDGDGDQHGDGAVPRSGLARALRGCRLLVRDMLAELDVMDLIEQDALAAEETWMGVVGAQLSEDARRRGNAVDVVPPWKML
ncbi:hypothetical protein F4861DRAFT_519301 [Xylaria intraflava]|nr:hypothetical protein F4861DRAFT_519301 [Xylaria intraflava]